MKDSNVHRYFRTEKSLVAAWIIILILFLVPNLNAEENTGKILYSCGFEQEEGFGKSGSNIEGQKGWELSTSGLKYFIITDGSVVKSKWKGSTGKQWLLIRSSRDMAITPIFDTSKYKNIEITFSMRPAGHYKFPKGYAGIIYFMDQNGKIMTRISLLRTGINLGMIKMYNTNRELNTGIPWKYSDKDSCINFKLKISQGENPKQRRWELIVNGKEATGSLMTSSKGSLAGIKIQGAACFHRHEIPTIDEIKVLGIDKKNVPEAKKEK